jgi:hypothetical protein
MEGSVNKVGMMQREKRMNGVCSKENARGGAL